MKPHYRIIDIRTGRTLGAPLPSLRKAEIAAETIAPLLTPVAIAKVVGLCSVTSSGASIFWMDGEGPSCPVAPAKASFSYSFQNHPLPTTSSALR